MTTILLADDLAENRYLLRALFKGHGFDAVEAANGAEALALASASPPDLIITDILMPVMDGFELCRRWKADERLRGIPFLFYTATYTELEDEKFALSLGAERFLRKPQSPELLMQVVREVLAEALSPPRSDRALPEPDEKEVLQHYNEALFRKLQKKVHDLEIEMAERKRLEVSLAQADRLASMGMLAAGVAHEINNPLSYVLYNLESLAVALPSCATRIARAHEVLMGCLGETKLREILGAAMVAFETEPILDVAACFRDALDGAKRIKEIVRGLSAFSRVENESLSLVRIQESMESAIIVALHEIKYRARTSVISEGTRRKYK
ncbi:MAG: response regulator [Myxococcota bacterium]|jgi:CheY-like chemotaxis protein|nr:response regulator [Myxococcota bacterium]